MPSYRNCACAICYQPLNRPQNTCGSRECRDAWKFLGRDARRKHLNLATMTPSERAYCLAAGPSSEELEAQREAQAVLDAEVAEYDALNAKKETPKFLRSMMDPANLQHLIRKEETDDESESS